MKSGTSKHLPNLGEETRSWYKKTSVHVICGKGLSSNMS